MSIENNAEVLSLTAKLVSFESTNPGNYEMEIGNFISDWLRRETGLPVILDEVLPDRFNVVCVLKGEKNDPALVSIHHMDVVTAGEGWNTEPFVPVFKEGRLYGRGSADMKAGLAAGLIAFRDTVKTVQKKCCTPVRDYIFIATVDEEGDAMSGSYKAVKSGYITKNSYVIDHEPSGSIIWQAHKGKIFFNLNITVSSNLSESIFAMSEIVCYIREQLKTLPIDEAFGPCTICFGKIRSGDATKISPHTCTTTLDMRLAPPLTPLKAISLIKSSFTHIQKAFNDTECTYEVLVQKPYIPSYPDSIFLQNLKEVVKEVTGKTPPVAVFTGYTDTAVIAAETGNKNALSYGPRSSSLHIANEWVDCASIIEICEVAKQLAYRLVVTEREGSNENYV